MPGWEAFARPEKSPGFGLSFGFKFGFLAGWPWAAALLGIKTHPTCPFFDSVMKLQHRSTSTQAHGERSIGGHSYVVVIFVFIRRIP